MPSGALRVPRGSCDFDGTMDLLGERHVLVILYLLFQRSPRGFNELKVAGEVNTATLSNRLKRLEALGIIERTVIRAIPRRVEYGITPMGRDLLKIFRTMMEWKAKYSRPGPRVRPARDRPGSGRRSPSERLGVGRDRPLSHLSAG
jgi:DNA-binding HxlR family transcriptional regulator